MAGPAVDQPSRLRTPPGVGPPLQAAGLPGQRHPPLDRTNPVAKVSEGALQSLVNRSALRIQTELTLASMDSCLPLQVPILLYVHLIGHPWQ